MIDPEDVTPAPAPSGRVFGYELRLNLSYCDPAKVKDPDVLLKWADDMAKILDLEIYGNPWLEHFGPDPEVLPDAIGNTLFVPVLTSNMIARLSAIPPGDFLVHANDGNCTVYVNIFYCAPEGEEKDIQGAVNLTIKAFGAEGVEVQDFTERRAPRRGQLPLTNMRPWGAQALGVSAFPKRASGR